MKLLASGLVLAVLGMAAVELTLGPTPAERASFAILFGAAAVVGALVGVLVRRAALRLHSMALLVAVVVAASLLISAATVGLSAVFMFLSGHDLVIALLALGLGVGLGTALALHVTRPLASDLAAIADTARRLGTGDLEARSGVQRRDEIGDAARALDSMADRLAESARLREADLRSRRMLLAAIGHDLRTPLSALQASIEALEDGVAADPHRYLRSMGRDVAALGTLVDDLFLLTRLESGAYRSERHPVDLAELADEAVEALAPVATRRRVELAVTAAAGATVLGTAADLSRAIRNLVDNAIRHAPAATTVRVEVSNGGPQATLRVIDDGRGFEPAFAARAFDHFVKGDPARGRDSGGAGLGLAIARGIVESHGGRIWIEPGRGGRVALQLPAGYQVANR